MLTPLLLIFDYFMMEVYYYKLLQEFIFYTGEFIDYEQHYALLLHSYYSVFRIRVLVVLSVGVALANISNMSQQAFYMYLVFLFFGIFLLGVVILFEFDIFYFYRYQYECTLFLLFYNDFFIPILAQLFVIVLEFIWAFVWLIMFDQFYIGVSGLGGYAPGLLIIDCLYSIDVSLSFHRFTIDCIFQISQIQLIQKIIKRIQSQNTLYLMSQLNKNNQEPKKKATTIEQSQLQQISSNPSSRNQVRDQNLHEEQHEIQLQQVNRQNQHLNQNNDSSGVNNPVQEVDASREVTFSQNLLNNKSKIMKWVMVVSILIFAMWFGSRFLTQSLARKRHPMFLSSFSTSKTSQVMSPQQSDYTSFLYYKKMLNLTQYLVKQKRDATNEQMKQFSDIKFKQFLYNYKVFQAIRISKQFSKTKQQQQQKIQFEQKDLDKQVNKTQYFFDAVNQFQCASCYSFPIAATIQYLYRQRYNISVKLSQQQLIDCAHGKQQQNGCQDGNITKGFQYSRDVGLVSTEQYPYRSITGTSYKCDQETINSTNVKKYKISGFKMLPSGNCQAIQNQLVKGNVVAAMINAGDLSSYTDGVFTDCKRYGLNHAITIVGQTEKNQWIIRNSWGKNWGNNGYFVMGHGNSCGVCTHAIVPILKMSQNGTVLPYDPKQDQIKKQDK